MSPMLISRSRRWARAFGRSTCSRAAPRTLTRHRGAPRRRRAPPLRRRSTRQDGRRRRCRRRPPPPGPADLLAEQRVAAPDRVEDTLRAGAQPDLERSQQRPEPRLDRARFEAERAGAVADLGGQRLARHRHVHADPDDRPALLRTSLDEDAGDLQTADEHVVRPLDPRLRPDALGHRDPRHQRQQPRRVPDHDRAQQRPTGRRAPRPTLTPAARGLLGRGHDRPVRGASGRELTRAGVRRVGHPEVEPRMAEHPGHGHSNRIRSSSSTASSRRAAASPWFTATASRRSASS